MPWMTVTLESCCSSAFLANSSSILYCAFAASSCFGLTSLKSRTTIGLFCMAWLLGAQLLPDIYCLIVRLSPVLLKLLGIRAAEFRLRVLVDSLFLAVASWLISWSGGVSQLSYFSSVARACVPSRLLLPLALSIRPCLCVSLNSIILLITIMHYKRKSKVY